MDDGKSEFHARLNELAQKAPSRLRRANSPTRGPRTDGLGESLKNKEGLKGSVGVASYSENGRPMDELPSADVVLLSALRDPELNAIRDYFPVDWQTSGQATVAYQVGRMKVSGGEEISIAAACQNGMGMVQAALLTHKAIAAWRPKLVLMLGVCAGVEGRANFGDIIIGKQVFDYGSGKIESGILVPDYAPLEINEGLTTYLGELAWDASVLRRIKDDWPVQSGRPDTELKAIVGPVCSGAAVVADDTVVKNITEHKRSIIGIDMEAFGVAAACVSSSVYRTPFATIKSVQDFANSRKNDKFRQYAAFTSASFAREFLFRHWQDVTPQQ